MNQATNTEAEATRLVCLEAAQKLRTYVGIYPGDKQAKRLIDELTNIAARATQASAEPVGESIEFFKDQCEQMRKEFDSIVGYNNKLLVELAGYRGKQIVTPAAPSSAPSTEPAAYRKLFIEWWQTEMDNSEFFNRTVRLLNITTDEFTATPERAPSIDSAGAVKPETDEERLARQAAFRKTTICGAHAFDACTLVCIKCGYAWGADAWPVAAMQPQGAVVAPFVCTRCNGTGMQSKGSVCRYCDGDGKEGK